jgi:ankyrin repeat protein
LAVSKSIHEKRAARVARAWFLCALCVGSAIGADLRLVDAVQQGDRAAVRALLEQKSDVNAAQGDGMTALHWAAFHNDVETVQWLIAAGANAKAVTRMGGITPLSLASSSGNAALIEILLKAGADVNAAAEDGATPLMAAALSGDAGAVTVLVKRGAEVNATEPVHGQTAMMFAAGKNRAAAIRALLSLGADPKVESTVRKLERPRVDEDGNSIPAPAAGAVGGGRGGRGGGLGGTARGASATVAGGMTALLLAARDGNFAAVRALVEGGAPVNQVSGGEKTSPLVIAICNGHYELAKYLLDQGADPNLATIDGLAALYAVEDTEWAQVGWAPNPITVQEKVTYLDLMKELLKRGANANARLAKTLWFRPTSHNQEWVDKKGATPFWRAAQSSDVAAMRILVAAGADPRIATEEGVTPLMVAAGLGWGANATRNVPDAWLATVKYCVELGLDVNAKDNYNYTALHGAAYRGDNEVVKFLVERGAKLDVRSKKGQTVSDMANGPMVNAHLPIEHPETIALLKQLGAPGPEVPVAAAPRQVQGGAAAPSK